jgi:hypothetical protein
LPEEDFITWGKAAFGLLGGGEISPSSTYLLIIPLLLKYSLITRYACGLGTGLLLAIYSAVTPFWHCYWAF